MTENTRHETPDVAELRRGAERCASDPDFPHDGLGRLVRALPALLDAAAERDALAAKVERVRALHQREVIAVHFEFGPEAWCPTCELHYPCPTIRALNEESK